MRLPALSFSLFALALAGCAGVAALPDVATVPHARLASSHVDVDNDRTDVFRVLSIDGHDVIDATDLSIKSVEVDHSDLIAAGRNAHIDVDSLAFYNNGGRRLFWDSMHVKGSVDFTPVAGATYVVRGTLKPAVSTVWVEDSATHQVVGKKVSAPGRGASAAEAEAEAASAAKAEEQ
ncbi:MAG: hypothetical protein ABIR54_06660 [Burkholderiaceae bacterium]